MKYTPLQEIQNKYSSISKYRKEVNSITIDGVFPVNKLNIPLLDFSDIEVISNTNFRVIIEVLDNQSNQFTLKKITSESFYNDLLRAKNEGNPYFINSSLNPKTFVKIYIDDLRNIFNKQDIFGRVWGVTVNYNVIFNSDGSVDYNKLGEYINWVLTAPKLEDIDTKGVIPSNQISSFNIGEVLDLTETSEEFREIDIENNQTSTVNPSTIEITDNTVNISETINTSPISNTSIVAEDPTLNSYVNEDRVPIPNFVVIDNKEFIVTPLPNDIVGSSSVSGEGNQGNIPLGESTERGGVLGGANTSNPQDAIANEYKYRERKTNREL